MQTGTDVAVCARTGTDAFVPVYSANARDEIAAEQL